MRRNDNIHCFSHKNFDLSQPEKLFKIRRKTCRFFNDSDSENEDENDKKADLQARTNSMRESFKLIKMQNDNLLKTNNDILSKLKDFQEERSVGMKKSILLFYSIFDKESTEQNKLKNQFTRMISEEFGSFRDVLNNKSVGPGKIQMLFNHENNKPDCIEFVNQLFSTLGECLPSNLVNEINFVNLPNNSFNKPVRKEEGFKMVRTPPKSHRSFSSLSNYKSVINMSIFNTSLNKEKLSNIEPICLKNSNKDSLNGFTHHAVVTGNDRILEPEIGIAALVNGALKETARPGLDVCQAITAEKPGVSLIQGATMQLDRISTGAHEDQLGDAGGIRQGVETVLVAAIFHGINHDIATNPVRRRIAHIVKLDIFPSDIATDTFADGTIG